MDDVKTEEELRGELHELLEKHMPKEAVSEAFGIFNGICELRDKFDPDTEQMLSTLREFYGPTDDGHIIRALLRKRVKDIKLFKKL